MKLKHRADTDSLYIDLSKRTSVESREISDGIVLDYDAAGHLVGIHIDIDNASHKVALQRLVVSRLPGELERIAGKRRLVAERRAEAPGGWPRMAARLERRTHRNADRGAGLSSAFVIDGDTALQQSSDLTRATDSRPK